MKILHKLKDGLDVFGKYWSLVIIILFTLPALEAVVFRYTLNKPTIWSQELCTLIFGAWFMIGGAYGEASNAHVQMDILYNNFRGYLKIFADTVIYIGCTLLCVVLIWKGWGSFTNALSIMQRTESLWAPVLWPTRMCIPLGSLLLWFRSSFTYADRLKGSLDYIRSKKKGGAK